MIEEVQLGEGSGATDNAVEATNTGEEALSPEDRQTGKTLLQEGKNAEDSGDQGRLQQIKDAIMNHPTFGPLVQKAMDRWSSSDDNDAENNPEDIEEKKATRDPNFPKEGGPDQGEDQDKQRKEREQEMALRKALVTLHGINNLYNNILTFTSQLERFNEGSVLIDGDNKERIDKLSAEARDEYMEGEFNKESLKKGFDKFSIDEVVELVEKSIDNFDGVDSNNDVQKIKDTLKVIEASKSNFETAISKLKS